jgi:hypothetical protein
MPTGTRKHRNPTERLSISKLWRGWRPSTKAFSWTFSTRCCLTAPATARNALFEQAVKTYPLIQRPGAMTALAQALHTAYKEEDNADNKKRMDSWLTEYKIPEVEATPTTTQTTKY